jgi:tetratricopeptide (TPR) repeat protein
VLFLIALPLLAADRAQSACDRSVRLILEGNYDAALKQLEGTKTAGTSPAEVENLRGLALLLEGDAAKAIASFDRALAIQPELEPARFNRALAYLRQKADAKAIADLEKIWKNEHSALRADAAYHLGIAYDRTGRAADAETSLENALKLDAKLDAALLYVGMLRERRRDWQGAGRAYREYMDLHPRSATALLRFGLTAHKAGRTDVARLYLQRAIDVGPHSAEAVEARKFLVMWE